VTDVRSRVRAQIVADIDCHESLALVAGLIAHGRAGPTVVMYIHATWLPSLRDGARASEATRPGVRGAPVDGVTDFRGLLAERTGGRTVPQIVIRGEPVGGARDLARLQRRGVVRARVDRMC